MEDDELYHSEDSTNDDAAELDYTSSAWRGPLREIVQSCSSNVDNDLLSKVETLFDEQQRAHESFVDRMREREQWKADDLKKKLESMRSAATMQGRNQALQLEQAKQEALAKLRKQIAAEMQSTYENQIVELETRIQELLRQLTLLDGGKAAAEYDRERAIIHVAEVSFRRMLQADLARGWETWVSIYDERKTMLAFATRMLSMVIVKCFNAWVESSEVSAHRQRLLTAAAGRLMKPALSSSFSLWRRDWEEALRDELSDGLLQRIQDLEDELRLVHYEAEAHLQAAATQARNELVSGLSDAAQREAEAVNMRLEAERREAEARKQEVMRLGRSAVRRMLHRDLQLGWFSWVASWEARTHSLHVLRRIIGRLTHRHLGRGFAMWVIVWEVERRRLILQMVANRLRNSGLSRGWTTWLAWHKKARMEQNLAIIARRLRSRDLTRGWVTWQTAWGGWRLHKEVLATAMSRLCFPKMCSSFAVWVSDWREGLPTEAERRQHEHEQHLALDSAETLRPRVANIQGVLGTAVDEHEVAEQLRLQREAEYWQREAEALRKKLSSTEQRARDQFLVLDRQLSQAKEQLTRARASAKEKASALASATERLDATSMPLSQQQRREIMRASLAEMQLRMERESETVAEDHLECIRNLTELVSLRDRQLLRSASTPKSGPSRRPGSAHARSLDVRPLYLQPKPGATLFVAPSSGKVTAAGVLVETPDKRHPASPAPRQSPTTTPKSFSQAKKEYHS